jgi:prophage antirepressor-like protein
MEAKQLSLNMQYTFNGEFPVRIVERDGELWFVAADVCKAVGVGNVTDVVKRLDGDEKDEFDLIDVAGRRRKMWIVNEPGMYSIILRSDKPAAKSFKRWVTHDVLPTIRKTGSYGKPKPVIPFQQTHKYRELVEAGYTPSQALEWHDRDTIGVDVHKRVVKEWYQRNGDIAKLTNHATRIVTGKSATALKREMQIKVSPRAYMSSVKKTALAIVEDIGATLHRRRDSHGTDELQRDLSDASGVIDWKKLDGMFPDTPLPTPLPKPKAQRLLAA